MLGVGKSWNITQLRLQSLHQKKTTINLNKRIYNSNFNRNSTSPTTNSEKKKDPHINLLFGNATIEKKKNEHTDANPTSYTVTKIESLDNIDKQTEQIILNNSSDGYNRLYRTPNFHLKPLKVFNENAKLRFRGDNDENREYLENSFEKNKKWMEQLYEHSIKLKATAVAGEETLRNLRAKTKSNFWNNFQFGATRFIIGNPITNKFITNMYRGAKVEIRSPPEISNVDSMRFQIRNPVPDRVKQQQAEGILYEYKKVYGFVTEKREEPFPRKPVDGEVDPSKIGDITEEYREVEIRPFQSRPRSRTKLKTFAMEEWEREELLKPMKEIYEYREAVQEAERTKDIAKKRWVFEEDFGRVITGKIPAKKEVEKKEGEEATEPESTEATESGATPDAEEERRKELMGEEEEEPIDEALAAEIKAAEEERRKKQEEKDALLKDDEDEAAEEEKDPLKLRKEQYLKLKDSEVKSEIRALLAKQEQVDSERNVEKELSEYDFSKALRAPLQKEEMEKTSNPIRKGIKSVVSLFTNIDNDIISWAAKIQKDLNPPPVSNEPLIETEQQMEERKQEEQEKREFLKKVNRLWQTDTRNEEVDPAVLLGNLRFRRNAYRKYYWEQYRYAAMTSYFRRLYGSSHTMKRFRKILQFEIIPPFLKAHLADDDDALRLVATPKVVKQLAKYRAKDADGGDVGRNNRLLKIEWIHVRKPKFVDRINEDVEGSIEAEDKILQRDLVASRDEISGTAMRFVGDQKELPIRPIYEKDFRQYFEKVTRVEKERNQQKIKELQEDIEIRKKRIAEKEEEKAKLESSSSKSEQKDEKKPKVHSTAPQDSNENVENANQQQQEEAEAVYEEDNDDTGDIEIVIENEKELEKLLKKEQESFGDGLDDGSVFKGGDDKFLEWYFSGQGKNRFEGDPDLSYLDAHLDPSKNKVIYPDVDLGDQENRLKQREIWTTEKDLTDEEIEQYWKHRQFNERLINAKEGKDIKFVSHCVPVMGITVRTLELRRRRTTYRDQNGVLQSFQVGNESLTRGTYKIRLRGPAGIMFGGLGWRVTDFKKYTYRDDRIP